MDDILLKCVGINKDIVEVYEVENIQKPKEAIVRIYLKGCGGIGKAKGHDQIFKITITGLEGSFSFIAKSNMKLIVGILYTKEGIILC